jgi:hypothetical protein
VIEVWLRTHRQNKEIGIRILKKQFCIMQQKDTTIISYASAIQECNVLFCCCGTFTEWTWMFSTFRSRCRDSASRDKYLVVNTIVAVVRHTFSSLRIQLNGVWYNVTEFLNQTTESMHCAIINLNSQQTYSWWILLASLSWLSNGTMFAK